MTLDANQDSITPIMVYFGSLGNRIEGRYIKQKDPKSPVALILPPDPRCGGTIDNQIVKILESIFVECGFTTLCINYQGFGKSEGVFRTTADGVVTASASIDWLLRQNPEASHYWIAGYSFGAYMAADLSMRRPEIEKFVFISPLIEHFDFSFMSPSLCCGLITVGENDDYIDKKKLFKLVEDMNSGGYNIVVQYAVIPESDHRYIGKTQDLRDVIYNYVNIELATRIAKPVKKKRRKRQKKDVIDESE